ncbi:flagellin [Campylobacter sp. RM12651]|uniref:flagellin N-terminal helical domain-containing protein n=14 Tax=Campylobacter TaxID=194 RepID=UPI0031F2ED89|nr:flagellin [Campylobacter sp. RM12651]
MGFRINTNVAALSAHANASMNNRSIDSSLNKLNSGFRINSAADDASGMAIADSLRSQASSLGQAIMNANDAIGIIQTADKAMDEQIKILDTIKNKAIQSAQDGQTTETRRSLQADISRLMEELDNIGNTTSFNGQKLLSGTFSNKEFQIGAYSNETVKASIGATTSDKIGLTRFETGHNVRQSDLALGDKINLTFKNVDGINDVTFEPVQIAQGNNIKAGQGLGALVEAINKSTDKTGIKASVTVQSVFEQPIKAGTTLQGFSINGVTIGSIEVKDKDGNGALRAAINSVKDQTGVEASVDEKGRLVLANRDGRGIKITDGVDKSFQANGAAYTETTSKTVADKHVLYANGPTGQNTKQEQKAIDFADDKTWTTGSAVAGTAPTADTAGSIYNAKNTFEDIQAAHYEMDARIAADGATKAKSAIQTDGTINFKTGVAGKALSADKIGALHSTANAAVTNPGAGKDVSDALKALQEDGLKLEDANKLIDNAVSKLQVFVDAAKGKTMATAEGEDGMAAHAMIQFLKGVKEGINEPNRAGLKDMIGLTSDNKTNFGRLSFSSTNGKDIVVEATRDYKDIDGNIKTMDITSSIGYDKNVSEKTVSLRETNATIDRETADAMGFNANDWQATDAGDNKNGYAAGVMTLKGAQAMMNIAESAQKALEAIRSDLGSVQNQLVSTVNNISVTQVNVKSAESNIRDVDFASESATFSKHQILAQSGVYAMSQANAVQQNVMRLLQ